MLPITAKTPKSWGQPYALTPRSLELITDASTCQFTQGIPIEVVPFAYAKVLQNVHAMGSSKAVLRMAVKKAGPVVTDNGNFVIDAPFPEETMKDPYTVSLCSTVAPSHRLQLDVSSS